MPATLVNQENQELKYVCLYAICVHVCVMHVHIVMSCFLPPQGSSGPQGPQGPSGPSGVRVR